MSKCLRCGAGSEWLEGKVPTSTRFVDEVVVERDLYRKLLEKCRAVIDDDLENRPARHSLGKLHAELKKALK